MKTNKIITNSKKILIFALSREIDFVLFSAGVE